MKLELLSSDVQTIAMLPVATPSPQALFSHQAKKLYEAGLCGTAELEQASTCLPHSGPFLYVPSTWRKYSWPQMLSSMTSNQGTSRMEVSHSIDDVDSIPALGYFATGYDAIGLSKKVSAESSFRAFARQGRSALTAMEVAFQLMYFPRAIQQNHQFGAAGSVIHRGDKEQHVPVFQMLADGAISLDSFYWGHRSDFTVFPSCDGRVVVH